MAAFKLCLLFLGLILNQLLALTIDQADLKCKTKLGLNMEKIKEMSPEEIEQLELKALEHLACVYKEMGFVDERKGTLKEKELVDYFTAFSKEAKKIIQKCIQETKSEKNIDVKIISFDRCIQK